LTRAAVRALAGAVALIVALAACTRSDPERELRATIASMAEAVEQHRVSDALGSLADDFTRESGAFGKPEARRMLAAAMLRNEKIRVAAAVTEVRIDGDRAFAEVRVVATGGAGLLPERGQTWDFDTAWRREQGKWKVFNAEWREGL
jgi:ketosteroid isomerase-like protein